MSSNHAACKDISNLSSAVELVDSSDDDCDVDEENDVASHDGVLLVMGIL
jgi:hypothetical protein